MGELYPDRGRQSVAHGAESTRGHPAVGFLEVEELRCPHLMLTDLGGDVDVAILRRRIEPLDGVLRLDEVVRSPVGQRLAPAPPVDLSPPRLQGSPVWRRTDFTPQPHHVVE